MFRTLVLAVAVLLPCAAGADEPLPPAEQWISQEAAVVVQVSDSKALLDLVLHPSVVQTVTDSPAYKNAASQPNFQQLENLVAFIEGQLGTDWQTALAKISAGGITWAVGPGGTSLLIVDAEDGQMFQKIHEPIRFMAKADAQVKGDANRVTSAEYRGVTGWTFGPKEAHAIVGNRLLLTNKPEALKAALDLRADPEGSSLAKLPAFQAAKKAAGSGAALVYFDMKRLGQLPKVQKALANRDNPLATLLFAPLTDVLRQSTWLGLGISAEKNALVVEAATDGALGGSPEETAFAQPTDAAGGAAPRLDVPRRIAAVSLWRDLHGFYAAKDELFPERTSGLIFFENMMGIFFTGRDLTEEVLAETGPEVRLVVAEQAYDPAVGTPQVQVPGFAAVFRLRNPERFGPVVEEAWQKAVGLVNFTRGQQALPGLIIDRPVHGDVKYTMASFSPPSEADKDAVPIRHNFCPTLAMPGDYLILSSTDALAEDLIDALRKETAEGAKPAAGTHSAVSLDGRRLASILGGNRENLIRQNMVEKGHTHEEAEAEIGMLVTVLEQFGPAELEVGTRDGRTHATLRVALNLEQ